MCGIGGVLPLRRSGPADPAQADAWLRGLAHRGPDDRDRWIEGPARLTHTRLSIIDLAGSPQPMDAADGALHLVFNGEIFNYRELRDVRSTTRSAPTATPRSFLALLAATGYAALQPAARPVRLRAPRPRPASCCAGPRPRSASCRCTTTATIAARCSPPRSRRCCAGRRGTPASSTTAQLRRLPAASLGARAAHPLRRRAQGRPGHRLSRCRRRRLTRRAATGAARPQSDRRLSTRPRRSTGSTTGSGAAVGGALVADVPVGSYLSGGVDSSLIVADRQRRPRTAGSTRSAPPSATRASTSSRYARRVSEPASAPTTTRCSVDAEDFPTCGRSSRRHRDAPFSRAGRHRGLPARRGRPPTRQGRAVRRGQRRAVRRLPEVPVRRASDRAGLVPAAHPAPVRRPARAAPARRRATGARIALRALCGRAPTMRPARSAGSRRSPRRARRAARSAPRRQHARRPGTGVATPSTGCCRLRPGQPWLPDNLLERGDRMSMAASLELRPPFLDHRLVELAFRLPSTT